MTRLADIVGASGLSIYAVIALVLFLVAFFLVVAALLAPHSRERYDHDALLPFDDGIAKPSVSPEVAR